MRIHRPMPVLLSLLLAPATGVAAAGAGSSTPAPLLLLTATAALAVVALFAAQSLLSRRIPRSAKTPPVRCVLQRDDAQEQKAAAGQQRHPLGSSVALSAASNGAATGVVTQYEPATDRYDVQLSSSETVTLHASQLQQPTVSALYVYPIKSCGGLSFPSAQLTPKGLLHDREWVIIDAARNKFVTQRRFPKMALIRPKLLPDAAASHIQSLVLTAEGMPDLEVPVVRSPDGPERLVSIWKDSVQGVDQGDAAAQWLDTFLGEERRHFRLVRVKDAFTRHTQPKYAPGHATNFADAFPFLLTLEASLTQLNEKLDESVPMNRFRPNIVLRGSPAFADEHWNCVVIGGLRFRNVRPCARCAMPSVDQSTGTTHAKREPSRTIVRERNGVRLGFIDGKKVEGYFGSNLVVELESSSSTPPQLAVGASVKVLTLKSEVVA
ncbi:hypothetical protein BBJ28_00014756 [Nothophytophthora sp. Chile5]|nr:hypothetical protein BBJ28_00014756 [Nothophytophthora sp. Chile5]